MEQLFIEDTTYKGQDFKEVPLKKGEYENCQFHNCDFSGTDLSSMKFINCKFVSCNLSLVTSTKTVFQEAHFKDCKLLGFRFDTCNAFGLSFLFENCSLNHSSFFGTKIKKTVFKHSQLQETDFTQCDLTSALFDHCNLLRAQFAQSILEKADFRTAYNYSIDPASNRMKKAKFSLQGIVGLLDKYDIDIE